MTLLRWFHRAGAFLLGAFIISHLAVHVMAYGGPEAHLAALETVQWIYRNPLGESLLVLIIVSQIITGARRLRFRNVTGWARVQVISGGYLLIFLLMHTSAALYTHHIFGLDTDFYWAAGSLHFDPIRWGFAIYYMAAIIAFFAHIAAALHFGWPKTPPQFLKSLCIAGGIVGIAIIWVFWGMIYPIDIGPDVERYYSTYFKPLGV